MPENRTIWEDYLIITEVPPEQRTLVLERVGELFAHQWIELAKRENWPAGRFKIKWILQWMEPSVGSL